MEFNSVFTENKYNQHLEYLASGDPEDRLEIRGEDLSNSDLSGANLSRADLSNSNLSGANLCFANLTNAILNHSVLRKADLTDANLRYAKFRSVDATNAIMHRSNLQSVHFSESNLSGVDLRYSVLCGSNLDNTTLTDAKLNNVIGNGSTITSYQLFPYTLTLYKDILAIGCQQHTVDKWFSFSDEEIIEMSIGALAWWNRHKKFIEHIVRIF